MDSGTDNLSGAGGRCRNIMHSSELCKTDRHDNGIVAGDTMMIHVKEKGEAYGVMELYRRELGKGRVMVPHLLGPKGQLMNKPNPTDGGDEMYYCPSGVSFAADTPSWVCVPVDEELFIIGKKSWPRRHRIWSVQDMIIAIREDR